MRVVGGYHTITHFFFSTFSSGLNGIPPYILNYYSSCVIFCIEHPYSCPTLPERSTNSFVLRSNLFVYSTLAILSYTIKIICLHISFLLWVHESGIIFLFNFISLVPSVVYLGNSKLKYTFFELNKFYWEKPWNVYKRCDLRKGKRGKYTPGMRTVCSEAPRCGKQRIEAEWGQELSVSVFTEVADRQVLWEFRKWDCWGRLGR